MKRLIAILITVMLILSAACYVTSLHPLYNTDDLIFDSALIGKWYDLDVDTVSFDFSKRDSLSYDMVFTDEEECEGNFTVHLLKIGKHKFLDLFPQEPELY